MRKLIGSLTVIAVLAMAGSAVACSMRQSASSDQQTVASAAAPATTTTTKTPGASIGG